MALETLKPTQGGPQGSETRDARTSGGDNIRPSGTTVVRPTTPTRDGEFVSPLATTVGIQNQGDTWMRTLHGTPALQAAPEADIPPLEELEFALFGAGGENSSFGNFDIDPDVVPQIPQATQADPIANVVPSQNTGASRGYLTQEPSTSSMNSVIRDPNINISRRRI